MKGIFACLFVFFNWSHRDTSKKVSQETVFGSRNNSSLEARDVVYCPLPSSLEHGDTVDRTVLDVGIPDKVAPPALVDKNAQVVIPQVLSHDSNDSDAVFLDAVCSSFGSSAGSLDSYHSVKQDLVEIIERSYEQDWLQWKESLNHFNRIQNGQMFQNPYNNVSLDAYIKFVRYINRDRSKVKHSVLLSEIGPIDFFLKTVPIDAYDEEIRQQEFYKQLPYFPVSLSGQAKKEISDYFKDRVDQDNWERFWNCFADEVRILPSSKQAVFALLNPVAKSSSQKSPFLVTKCNKAPCPKQRVNTSLPKNFFT